MKQYKKGDETSSGIIIEKIINYSPTAQVYLREDGEIGYEFESLVPVVSSALDKYDEINSHISSELPQDLLIKTKCSLGAALFHASFAKTPEDTFKCFDSIESRVKNIKTPNQAKTILVLFNLLFTFLVLFFSIMAYIYYTPSYGIVFLCVGSGSFGALFSILQRNSEITLNLTGGIKYTILQAGFITILGGMSGCVIYLVSMSDLAFSFASDNTFTLVTLAIIAGFSERLIPDLFEKIEK